MAFKLPATPALNKDGYAKITFVGVEEGESKPNTSTGEIRTYMKLQFTVMDTTRTNPIKVNLIGSELKDELLQAMEVLGLDLAAILDLRMTEDEDGFGLQTAPLAEDGFGKTEVDGDEINDRVMTFLQTVAGTVLLGKVAKVARGKQEFWEIDVDTLKLLSK